MILSSTLIRALILASKGQVIFVLLRHSSVSISNVFLKKLFQIAVGCLPTSQKSLRVSFSFLQFLLIIFYSKSKIISALDKCFCLIREN